MTLATEARLGTASAWTFASRGPDLAPPPGALVRLTPALALRSAVYSLAGPIAEARAGHRAIVTVLNGAPALRDLAAVDAELPDVSDRARALEAARLLVLNWWPVIVRVAEVLLLVRTLDGPGLADLLPAALQRRRPGVVPGELPPELAARLWKAPTR